MSDPQVEQEALNARLALQSAEAALENLRVQLQNDLLTQEAQVATVDAEFRQAQMDAEANEALAKEELVSATRLCCRTCRPGTPSIGSGCGNSEAPLRTTGIALSSGSRA